MGNAVRRRARLDLAPIDDRRAAHVGLALWTEDGVVGVHAPCAAAPQRWHGSPDGRGRGESPQLLVGGRLALDVTRAASPSTRNRDRRSNQLVAQAAHHALRVELCLPQDFVGIGIAMASGRSCPRKTLT
jgi:hypothetical protein